MDKTNNNPIRIALCGLGTVGTAVWQHLHADGERLAAAVGRPLSVRRILIRQAEKERPPSVPSELLTTDAEAVLADDVDIVLELMGGTTTAAQVVAGALQRQRPVVTANKALIARQGPRLAGLAADKGVDLRFEASVGAGIPLVEPLVRSLAPNQITGLAGIFNGTTNYILGRMEDGLSYDAALAEAQEAGYAEADPEDDVSGRDAAYKLVILAGLAFGQWVSPDDVDREGITALSRSDVQQAAAAGKRWKLVAEAQAQGPALTVMPKALPADHPLARTAASDNAIRVDARGAGPLFFQGAGAGGAATASAVVADLIAAAGSLDRAGSERRPSMVLRSLSQAGDAESTDIRVSGAAP